MPDAVETFAATPDGDPSRPRLFARWSPVQDTGRPPVVVVHGFGEHSGRYLHVLRALALAGHASLAFDYRGFGRAGGRRAFVRRFDEYLDDVQWAVTECRRRAGDGAPPPVLLGHSQGGLIAVRYAQDRGEDLGALALSSPALRFLLRVPRWKHFAGLVAARIWPTFALPAGIDPADLSRDRTSRDVLEHDPFVVRRATARFYAESRRAQQLALDEAARLTMPTLFLVAGADRVVDAAVTRAFHDRCTNAARTWREYADARHEVFQELPETRERALADLVAWLAER